MNQIRDLTGKSNAKQVNVHRGFLHETQELVPHIENEFKFILVDNAESPDVVFTCLLFAQFLSHAFWKYEAQLLSPYVRLSCITFSSPPILTTSEFLTFRSLQNPDTLGLVGKSLILSDSIPRADEHFVNVLPSLLAEPSSTDPASPQDSKSRDTFRSRSQCYKTGSAKQLSTLSLLDWASWT